MKGLETGKDKIQKISDQLRKETLEPAKQEAKEIVENAQMQASQIVDEAKKEAKELIESAEKEIEEKRKVFESSLALASRQGLEALRQKIENEFFRQEFAKIVSEQMQDPKLIANIINAYVELMDEKGEEEDFSAYIAQNVSAKKVSEQLGQKVLEKMEKGVVLAGDFAGGVKIQLKNSQVTIDISDEVVKDLVYGYIRKDLRDLVFNA